MDAHVIGAWLEFIAVAGSIAMPIDETDINPAHNIAFDCDVIYLFIFKDTFDCSAPGTIESSHKLLSSLLQ